MWRLVGDLLLVLAFELAVQTARCLASGAAAPAGVGPESLAYQRWEIDATCRLASALVTGTLAGIVASTGLAFRTARR